MKNIEKGQILRIPTGFTKLMNIRDARRAQKCADGGQSSPRRRYVHPQDVRGGRGDFNLEARYK